MQLGPKQDVERLKLGIRPIVEWLIRMTPTCNDITRLVSDGMDRPLPLGIRVKIRLHFLICKWCERYKHQLLFLRHAIRRHPDQFEHDAPDAPAALSPDAKERLKQALRKP